VLLIVNEQEHVESVIQKHMKEMTLVEFENKMTKTLSGGNKRKLSVAIAMIGKCTRCIYVCIHLFMYIFTYLCTYR
jgi:ABC-type multidrug transport system ATPase subunit